MLNVRGLRGHHAERIAGLECRAWIDTTIRGQADCGTGILNNTIDVGRLSWGRCSYVKDPRTGKRVARPNPKSLRGVFDTPELRIVDDALWEAVKARQAATQHAVEQHAGANGLDQARRRQFLLSAC